MAGSILGSLLLEIVTKANIGGLSKTDASLKKVGKTLQRTAREASVISKLSGKLFSGLNVQVVGDAFKKYLEFEKDLGAMKSRFFAITGDEQKAVEEFDFIRKVATDTANDIKTVADSYSIFYSAASRPLGQEGARSIFKQWTEISRVLHLAPDKFKSVTYALREMSSKGQLYSQDLKIQLGTHVPDAVGIATEAIQNLGIKGVSTVEEFQKLTQKNPKGGYMPKFLQEFSKVAHARFASPEALKKALEQPDALEGIIHNIGYNFMVEFSKAGGNYMIVKILQGVANTLTRIDYITITQNLGQIAHFVGDVASFLPQIVSILKNIALSIIIFKAGKGLIGLFKGLGVLWKTFSGFSKTAPFITKLFYSLGKAFPAISKFATFLAGNGLRSTLIGILAPSGPLGWLVLALSFLPEIISVVKFLANKLGYKDKSKLPEFIGGSGVSTDRALEILKDLKTKGIQSPEQLNQALNKYGAEGLRLQPFFNIDDTNNIKIYVNGVEVAPTSIKEDKKTEVKEQKSGGWFNKPKKQVTDYKNW